MSTTGAGSPVLVGCDVSMTFRRGREVVRALDQVSLSAGRGTLTALVGPDGAGKTTLIRLAAGLLTATAGRLQVLGVDVAVDPQSVQSRVGYMPQRFGLYEDLSVMENMDLYADLHSVTAAERRDGYPRLLEMTALGPFVDRLAGRLSGGMKQKLGLACTLVRSPELLLLDEPTVGVDPLSRRELWAIILQLVRDQGLSVLLSTSYLDEAERCDHAIVLHQGRVLVQGQPAEISALAAGRTLLVEPSAGQPARELQAKLMHDPDVVDAVPEGGRVRLVLAARSGGQPSHGLDLAGAKTESVAPRFEDGFMVVLRQAVHHEAEAEMKLNRHSVPTSDRAVVEAHDLVRRFGTFTAVDHVSFEVRRGEVFGLLGPNGAGKTTTFRMLCGLLAATGGTLSVAGVDLRTARASARQRVGYVAQKFSLYDQLSVTDNLEFFAGAYGLDRQRRRERIAWALEQFELGPLANLPAGRLPGGFKQRLAMAAALLHEPDILFLDEPTSGADPLARREFWRRITALAEQGVTVIVTTHFMEEAEYCDRVAILDAGRVLAQGTPAEIRNRGRSEPDRPATMEDAFVAIVEESRRADSQGAADPGARTEWLRRLTRRDRLQGLPDKARRVAALIRKETLQVLRDPSSIAIGIVLPALLILLFGYGLALDVKDVPVALVVENPSPDAADVAAGFQLSRYFKTQRVTSLPEAQAYMLAGKVDAIVRLRWNFDRQLHLADAPVQVLVNGVDADRARIILGYTQGAIAQWSAQQVDQGRGVAIGPVLLRDRLWFNEANDSHYFLVPGLIVLIITLIGALLTALVMAREWESGTLESLFVTPVRVGEILLGKTVPYFVLGLGGMTLCILASRFLFHVPLRGSLGVLATVSVLYLLVTLGLGLLISTATKNQFAASQVTLLVTFLPAMMLSGFLFDLLSVPAFIRALTYVLPARYFVALLQTVFLAGDVWEIILPNGAMLAAMAVGFLVLARLVTRKKLT